MKIHAYDKTEIDFISTNRTIKSQITLDHAFSGKGHCNFIRSKKRYKAKIA